MAESSAVRWTTDQVHLVAFEVVDSVELARSVCTNLRIKPPLWLSEYQSVDEEFRKRFEDYVTEQLKKEDRLIETAPRLSVQREPEPEPEPVISEETPPPAVEQSAEHEYTMVDVDDIVHSPTQPRTIKDEEAFERLVESVREVGLKIPPIVIQRNDGKYEILDGHRRYEAARKAGYTRIGVLVAPTPESEDDKFEFQTTANAYREELAFPDLLKAIERLAATGRSQRRIAAALGVTQPWVSQALKVIRNLGVEKATDLWRHGVKVTAIVSLAQAPDTERQRLVESAYELGSEFRPEEAKIPETIETLEPEDSESQPPKSFSETEAVSFPEPAAPPSFSDMESRFVDFLRFLDAVEVSRGEQWRDLVSAAKWNRDLVGRAINVLAFLLEEID